MIFYRNEKIIIGYNVFSSLQFNLKTVAIAQVPILFNRFYKNKRFYVFSDQHLTFVLITVNRGC